MHAQVAIHASPAEQEGYLLHSNLHDRLQIGGHGKQQEVNGTALHTSKS